MSAKNARAKRRFAIDRDYDAAGRLTNENDTGTLITYTYDDAGQLTADGATTVTYDATGNRDNGSYTTTTGNELTSDGTSNYSYDAAGNMTKQVDIASGDTWKYGYDNDNRLVSAKDWTADPDVYGTGEAVLELDAEYAYDVLGNRIQKAVTDGGGTTTTRYAYDMWNPAKAGAIGTSASDIWATLDGSSSLTSRQLQGDGIDQHFASITGSTAYWYLTDHLGSVRTVLDNSGSPVDAVSYDAFGNITSETTPADRGLYSWTGRELDAETGLQYNRARYYDPSTARWISQDPLGFDAGDSNLYRYVKNRVSGPDDPSGYVIYDFIAVGLRRLAGIAAVSGYWHASVAYFRLDGCHYQKELDALPFAYLKKVTDLNDVYDGVGERLRGLYSYFVNELAGVQLMNDSGWQADYQVVSFFGARYRTTKSVGVSLIHYNDETATDYKVEAAGTTGEMKALWSRVISFAKSYPYAEQPNGPKNKLLANKVYLLPGVPGIKWTGDFANWPKSWYTYSVWDPSSAPNSNTFVKAIASKMGWDLGRWANSTKWPGTETPVDPNSVWPTDWVGPPYKTSKDS